MFLNYEEQLNLEVLGYLAILPSVILWDILSKRVTVGNKATPSYQDSELEICELRQASVSKPG